MPSTTRHEDIGKITEEGDFEELTPIEFTRFMSDMFMQLHQNVATKLTWESDSVVDFVLYSRDDTVAVQVKKYDEKRKVGKQEINQLLDSMWRYEANKAIFITTSDFTPLAYKLSKRQPVALWRARGTTEEKAVTEVTDALEALSDAMEARIAQARRILKELLNSIQDWNPTGFRR